MGIAGLSAAALIGCSDDSGSGATATATAASGATGTATGTEAPPKLNRGGVVRLGTWRFPPGVDPDYSSTGYHMQRVAFDSLLGADADGIPSVIDDSLAASMEIPDGNTFVIGLKQGVKFHDGTDFNAEAVAWNIARTRAEDPPGSVFRSNFATLDSVDVVDEFTVRFNLTQPDAAFPAILSDTGATMLSPTHYDGKALTDVQWRPVGTGPYMFSDYSQDSFVKYVPFPDHFYRLSDGGPPAMLDEFSIVSQPDEVVQVASLQVGDIEMIEESPASQLTILNDSPDLVGKKFDGFANADVYINHGLYPLDNVHFRRAVMLAWDPQGFNDLFYAGGGRISDSILTSASWAYTPVPGYPTFNREEAKKELEASGVPEGDRKFLFTGDTQQFQYIQDQLAQVGITAEFVSTADAAGRRNKNRGETGDVHATLTRFTGKFDPHQVLGTMLGSTGSSNYSALASGNIDELLLKGVATYDLEERRAIYADIQKQHAENLYGHLTKLEIPFWLHAKKGITGLKHFRNGRGDYRSLAYEA